MPCTCATGPMLLQKLLTHCRRRFIVLSKNKLLPVFLLLGPECAPGAAYLGDPGNYTHLLSRLRPGDSLTLEAGRYSRGLRVHNLHGSPEHPIVIQGPAGRDAAVLLGRPGSNTVSIANASHVVVRNLEIDGQGAFVDAVKAEGHADFAHHITLENLYIHNFARDQQSVGISTKCPAWDWTVRGNRIEGVGTGMYFGNSDGSDPFIGGVIEDNLVVDTIGYNVQIKHQVMRPALAGMPQDHRITIIRRNRFIKGEGSSQGAAARPNVLVGHFPLQGPGNNDEYAIYGNLFFQNPGEALFQGEGNVALYSNLFFNSHRSEFPGIAIQPHNDIPRRIRIFFNTVVSQGQGIRVLPGAGQEGLDQQLVGNAVFQNPATPAEHLANNFVAGFGEVSKYLRSPVADPVALSLVPCDGRLPASHEITRFAGYPESDRDFDGRLRDGRTFGALSSATGTHCDSPTPAEVKQTGVPR